MGIVGKKPLVAPVLALSALLGFAGFCLGAEAKGDLIVKEIALAADGESGEKVSVFCSRSCLPEMFSLEGESPRVVMDLKEVSLLQARARQVRAGGKFVKAIRTYLDKETKVLRIVLDMDPSKYVLVYPVLDSPGAYTLKIEESQPSAPRREEGGNESPPRESRVAVLESAPKQAGPKEPAGEAAPPRPETARAAESPAIPSADQGRAQLHSGDFKAAVDTFTRIIAAQPQDSLGYRLRGNAYDNLDDRPKALEDWIRAARLGDVLLQSYLDFLQVQWRDKAAP